MREMGDLQASLSHAIPCVIIYPDSALARESFLYRKRLTSRDQRNLTVFAGVAVRGGNAGACALALVLNPKPAVQQSQQLLGNFGRSDGDWPVLGTPSPVAGRNLGKVYALGPSSGDAAPLFLCLDLGKFCTTFICNWSCLLPSHLGRHGDLSSFSFSPGKMGEA